MTISSQTPEGLPNRCPICRADVIIEPSVIFGDATCPYCGSLLWFLKIESTTRLFDRSVTQDIWDRIIAILASSLGVDPDEIIRDRSFLNDLAADSLDAVELVMAFEEEFDDGKED